MARRAEPPFKMGSLVWAWDIYENVVVAPESVRRVPLLLHGPQALKALLAPHHLGALGSLGGTHIGVFLGGREFRQRFFHLLRISYACTWRRRKGSGSRENRLFSSILLWE